MSADTRIRLARPDDGRAMAALHGRCGLSDWDLDSITGYLGSAFGFGLLAWHGTGDAAEAQADAAVGFLLCRLLPGDEAELLTIGVLPDARRQGIASALLRVALREAAARGAGCLFLEVAEDNAAALRLYERQGFAPAGRREGYYPRPSGPAVAALVLRRDIGTDPPP